MNILIFLYESIKTLIIKYKLLKNNNYLLKILKYFIKIYHKYNVIKMAENIVKFIIRVFLTENTLKNLEKIKSKVCKIEVIVITENKSNFFGDL